MNAAWVRGHTLLAGHPPGWLDTLTLADLLDVLVALWVQRVEAHRGWKNDALDVAMAHLGEAPFALRDEWGTRPDQRAGQRAMMDLAGGPAQLREPKEATDP